ncbi:signal recognition particle [Methanocella sp. CWC-04]|uniref:Signal recognition particle 19 kDa protein n=2 Tax=Methanooceanicella nereidis TaxID=2052831 RepID=A0AAP2W603_9EURY|nr:signal recognition particle [Methanocella sp. CWC-04]
MKQNKKIIIWPIYLDLSRTRNEGRLTPKEFSVKSPKASEIVKAADNLGLHPEIYQNKVHPSIWWEKTGYVAIDNIGPKSDLLRRIGKEIIRMRGGKQ